MLPILASFALSTQMMVVAPTNKTKTAFDLQYVDDEGVATSITGGEGFYVAYQQYNDHGEKEPIRFLGYDQEINTGKAKVLYGTMPDRDKNNKRVHIYVENIHPTQILRFDLGIFADANFKSDNDTLSMIHHYRAFEISSLNNDGSQVMLIVNGSCYPSVNSLYLGAMSDSASTDAKNYPFWTHSIGETTSAQDSVFAFSWQDCSLMPGESEKYGFIAVPSTTYSMEPFVRDLSPVFTDMNNYGWQTLKFEAIDYDDADKLTVYVLINGEQKKTAVASYDPKVDKASKIVKYDINLEEGHIYKYMVYAVDKSGYKSNIIDKTILAQGAQKPQLKVDVEPQKSYLSSELIYVEGKVEDDYEVYICYQFDNMPIQKDSNYIDTLAEGMQAFTKSIQIPPALQLGQKHTLKIWAVDDYDIESDKVPFEFELVRPGEPYINELYLSVDRVSVEEGARIVVYGTGSGSNPGDVVSIMVSLDGKNEQAIGSFTSKKEVQAWSAFYTVPAGVDKGRHAINVSLQSHDGKRSNQNYALPVLVWPKDEALPAAEIGKILDVSATTIKEPSNALFNLHYVSKDGIESKTTFNDEGFFAAFRVHTRPNGGPAKELHVMKYSGEVTSMYEDNFQVNFSITDDKYTKYKILEWTVRNDDFFPKLFELGVFADSDFSGDENTTIRERDDGLGIIITNNRLGIHYSLLTKVVTDGVPVTNHFIKGIERTGTSHIPVDQIPFFNKTTNTNPLSKANAAYGFSWKVPVEPGKKTKFAVYVAAYDKVKSAPRFVDNTVLPNTIKTGDQIKLSFETRDADRGEQVVFTVFTYTKDDRVEKLFEPHINDKDVLVFNKTYTIKDDDEYFAYAAQAFDNETDARFPSRTVRGRVDRGNPPTITLTEPIKGHYHTKNKITLAGTLNDPDVLGTSQDSYFVVYQFLDGEYRSRELRIPNSAINYATGKFKADIDIPSGVPPREEQWGITVYATDLLGHLSGEQKSTFKLNPYSPPVLKKAGLSRKTARAGETILGYAILSDKQKDPVRLFIKVGKDSEYPETSVAILSNDINTGKERPIAFHWTVPKGTQQIADVYFMAKDFDDIPSNEYRQTLIITQ